MMKRVLSFFLCVVLVLGCAGCSRNKAVSPDGLTPGTYDASHPQFEQLREYYFDYFWEMYGVQHLFSNKEGKYSDEDVITFAFIYLFRGLGENINEGVTKKRLNEVAEQYLSHTIKEFDTSSSMVNTATDKVHFTQFNTDYFGDLFVLQSLVVKKDGTHQGIFHRCDLPRHFWENTEIAEPFEKILHGNYAAFGNDITVTPTRVVFNVLLDENDKQYLNVSLIREQV